jgi:hypothetical protein
VAFVILERLKPVHVSQAVLIPELLPAFGGCANRLLVVDESDKGFVEFVQSSVRRNAVCSEHYGLHRCSIECMALWVQSP